MEKWNENSDGPLMDEKLMQTIEGSLKNLRVADLELFITATHLKNLGKAAQYHHLSQSAASTAVQRVELAFGVPLSAHEKRQFRLTREGEAFFPQLENWVKQLRNMILSKDQIPLRFVTTHSLAQIALPALLSVDHIEFTHMRPDHAYEAILNDKADIALVLDNSSWKEVLAAEVGRGRFQLYSSDPKAPMKPVLLPEDQMEVLALQQSWHQEHGVSLPVKSRIPSWTLIAHICRDSKEVGFLPDFLAKKFGLHPVLWQAASSEYRVLAIYRKEEKHLQGRFASILKELRSVF